MSNKYKEQAQDILTAIGSVKNIVDAIYDTKCITTHMQHTIPSIVDEVRQIVDATSVAEDDTQLVIKLNGNADEVYQQSQRLIKNANAEESKNIDNINSQDANYTPQVKVATPILVKTPITGRYILLREVKDSIFREKMVGEGLAIEAYKESKVVTPLNGLISMIVPAKRAVGIQSRDGVDIVIRIGLSIVDLEDKGFKCFVRQDDHVKAG